MRPSHLSYKLFKTMEALRSTEKSVSIKTPWGNISGLAWGNPADPPVLLCHGKLDVCTSFRPLVSKLPSCLYYVSIDLPGNGRSDHLPVGLRYGVVDLVPSIVKVMEHFQWKTFRYIGHSLGVPIGKLFDIAYPGHMTRMVELDPIPAHHTWPITREGLRDWYHEYYGLYNDDKYVKFNGGPDTAPSYEYKQAQELMMNTRGISEEATEHVLERCLVAAKDGKYRFTFDQRMKEVPVLPYSGDLLRQIYTTTTTPTLCVLSKDILEQRVYEPVEFLLDPKIWRGDYRFKIVEGGHDIHLQNPGDMAEDIGKFLMEDFRAKL